MSATFDVRLTDEQVDEFWSQGFTHVERITTDEELASLEPIYDALFASKQGAFKGGYFDLARPYESDGEDLGFAYRAIGVWVPLDPATVESGCMHFLPGSHRGDVQPHRHIDDDPNVHGLEMVTPPPDDDAVPVELAPGGATFHHCRTMHMTPPNVSNHVRRAWANEVQAQPVPLPPGEAPDYPWVREGQAAWAARTL